MHVLKASVPEVSPQDRTHAPLASHRRGFVPHLWALAGQQSYNASATGVIRRKDIVGLARRSWAQRVAFSGERSPA